MVGGKGRKTCVKPVFVKSIVRSRQSEPGKCLIMSGMEVYPVKLGGLSVVAGKYCLPWNFFKSQFSLWLALN